MHLGYTASGRACLNIELCITDVYINIKKETVIAYDYQYKKRSQSKNYQTPTLISPSTIQFGALLSLIKTTRGKRVPSVLYQCWKAIDTEDDVSQKPGNVCVATTYKEPPLYEPPHYFSTPTVPRAPPEAQGTVMTFPIRISLPVRAIRL